ncbi:imidazole glycerol phosphate synthase subunit HisH [Kaistella sp. G5-32]|uniref:Imidazole glycerol phosphate synthase subunit HisH n=1 Tax=Kaistella gelatinilytica TaxID=2787636 RepID=A0ABS0FBV0_9FLAO|nr:imidazole glycerol phosphate synthase subunit HisH [Kaistella gelatinilytica]MBF8457197.1 imidazole glycerol phosphate synthase subunit HisH [Kaistella gelatinilytica]
MVTIIDYGVGNIKAFVNVFKRVNIQVQIAKNILDLEKVEKLILPGVGHFDYAMEKLNNSGMREQLDHLVLQENIPVMGICVGLQMMANRSDEGKMDGLKWIDASVKKLDETKIQQITKLPHMGWNEVKPMKDIPLFKNLEKEAIFYFLHSYYFHCHHSEDILAVSDYGIEFASAVHHQNKFGVQFHPEKSHQFGEILLHNFAKL